eukprot:1300113-Amphidinium_carterae.6
MHGIAKVELGVPRVLEMLEVRFVHELCGLFVLRGGDRTEQTTDWHVVAPEASGVKLVVAAPDVQHDEVLLEDVGETQVVVPRVCDVREAVPVHKL